jgi:hypothetical protein
LNDCWAPPSLSDIFVIALLTGVIIVMIGGAIGFARRVYLWIVPKDGRFHY